MKISSQEVKKHEEIPFWFNPYNQLFGKIYSENSGKIEDANNEENIKVVVVGSYNKKVTIDEVQFSMSELNDLITSIGHKVIKMVIQRSNVGITNTYIGRGKAQEIKEYIEKHKVDYIVCNHELSPAQYRNLHTLLGIPIVDRTMVVLELFQRNSKTDESKLQVKIAEYNYLLPRINSLVLEKHNVGRNNGAFLSKGSGESAYNLTQRKIKERIRQLEKEIEHRKISQKSQSKSRENCFKVVLVGYTNAGKTTLINALTSSSFGVSNNVFETLDSFYRRLNNTYSYGISKDIIVADTVGFMSNLPSTWFEGFSTTINDIKEADLLIHVIDSNDLYIERHIQVVNDILFEIGIEDKKIFYVFTKRDNIEDELKIKEMISAYQPNIFVNTNSKVDVMKVHKHIVECCENTI